MHQHPELIAHIASNEAWLKERFLEHAVVLEQGKFSDTLEAEWSAAIAGLTRAIIKLLEKGGDSLDTDSFAEQVVSLSVMEVLRHRARGVGLAEFLRCFKFYRRSFIELVRESALPDVVRREAERVIANFFDQLEINLCASWGAAEAGGMGSREAEAFLINEKNKYLGVFETIDHPVFLITPQGRLENMNQAAAHLVGRNGASSGACGCATRDGDKSCGVPANRGGTEMGELLPWLASEINLVINGEQRSVIIDKIVSLPGGERRFEAHISRLNDISGSLSSAIVLLSDNTPYFLAEQAVQASLREKEVLIREIHHRVKNNLQIISSLLHLQGSAAQDEKLHWQLKKLEGRIRSMALVHEKLYFAKDNGRIDFGEYVRSLTCFIAHTYGAEARRVRLGLQVEAVHLHVDKAVPCGLLLGELLTNSFKHAFNGEGGAVKVELRTEGKIIVMTVADDGKGLPESYDPGQPSSLGLQIIAALVNQLGGEIIVSRQGGASITVRFPLGG